MLTRRISPKYSNRRALTLSENWKAPYGVARELDEFFADFFDPNDRSLGLFRPAINVCEDEANLEITAELPGLTEEDIDISVTNNQLTLKGEKKQEWDNQDGNVYRAERMYGSFCRTVRLPVDKYDIDRADAVFKNGVLTLTVPKLDEVQISTRIEVKSG